MIMADSILYRAADNTSQRRRTLTIGLIRFSQSV